MKYNDLWEYIWSADTEQEREARIAALDPVTRKAWDVIELFLSRKGFEYWWVDGAAGAMSRACSDEIFEELKQLLSTTP